MTAALRASSEIRWVRTRQFLKSFLVSVKAVFLLCLAALIPLGVAEWYSGHDAPSKTGGIYDTLESILVWLIFSCIFVWILAEAWREIRFNLKAKSERERGEP